MKPLNAREFVEMLNLRGCEWVGELHDALDYFEKADEHTELFNDIQRCTPKKTHKELWRAIEWLNDRSDLVDELQKMVGEGADIVGEVKEAFDLRKDLEELLKARGFEGADILTLVANTLGYDL